jgi:hypothetical protein
VEIAHPIHTKRAQACGQALNTYRNKLIKKENNPLRQNCSTAWLRLSKLSTQSVGKPVDSFWKAAPSPRQQRKADACTRIDHLPQSLASCAFTPIRKDTGVAQSTQNLSKPVDRDWIVQASLWRKRGKRCCARIEQTPESGGKPRQICVCASIPRAGAAKLGPLSTPLVGKHVDSHWIVQPNA